MAKINIPFVKKQVRVRLRRDGSLWRGEYWYYRRKGAPDDKARIPGAPGEPEFERQLKLYNARAEHREPEQTFGTFSYVWKAFSESGEFKNLGATTAGEYRKMYNRLKPVLGPYLMTDTNREIGRRDICNT
jgi:hypothetical protein